MKSSFLILIVFLFNNVCTSTPHEQGESDFIQEKITDNLYIIKATNYNTNAGLFIGDQSILLIDPMMGFDNHQNLHNFIKTITEKPIEYVINTHNHIDHSGANQFFEALGATIISQENAIYSRAKVGVTFKDVYTIDMGNEKVELFHIAAHTFDDALVYFPNANTVFMGDTYMTNSFPHFYYGGGSKGHLAIIDKALSLGNQNTFIIPAHGMLLSSKEKLNVYKQNSIKWIGRIKELADSNKTPEEIARDERIKTLSTIFTGSENLSLQSILQTIEKTIAADLISATTIPDIPLESFIGKYEYENGQIDEIVWSIGKLILRSEKIYMYEITPLTATKFQIKGQFPNKYLIFNSDKAEFTFNDGKENSTAKKL